MDTFIIIIIIIKVTEQPKHNHTNSFRLLLSPVFCYLKKKIKLNIQLSVK